MSRTSCSGSDLRDRSHVAVAQDPSATSSRFRRRCAPAPGRGQRACCDGPCSVGVWRLTHAGCRAGVAGAPCSPRRSRSSNGPGLGVWGVHWWPLCLSGPASLAGDGLNPGEHLLDAMARLLAQPVAGAPAGAPVDGRAPARGALGDVQRGPELTRLKLGSRMSRNALPSARVLETGVHERHRGAVY
jgi:hypothetical protein